MAKANRIQRLLLVGLLSATPLVACGGDDDESSSREDVTGGADEDILDEDAVVPAPEDVADEEVEEDTHVEEDTDTEDEDADVEEDTDVDDVEDDADTTDEDADADDGDADEGDADADEETDVIVDPDQACRDALDIIPEDAEAIAEACACDAETWRDFATVTCRPCEDESFTVEDFDLDESPGFDPETGFLRLVAATPDIDVVEVEITYYWVRFADDGYFAANLQTATGTLDGDTFVFDLSEDAGFLADSAIELHAVRATGRCGVDRTTRRVLLPGAPFGQPDDLALAPCFDTELASEVPLSEAVALNGEARFRGGQNESCAIPRGQDKILQWTAPADATYRVFLEDTFAMGIYIARGACEAPVEVCTNPFDQLQELEFEATEGEIFQIVLGTPQFSSTATIGIEAVEGDENGENGENGDD